MSSTESVRRGTARRVVRTGALGQWRRTLIPAVVVAGYAVLVAALAAVLYLPNGWLPVALAGLATLLLSLDRRLGPLPAALLVMIAIPVGRGAEVGLPRVGDLPVRPHDVAAMVGAGLAIPAMFDGLRGMRGRDWMAALPIIAFGLVGILAMGVGLAGDQAIRDVVRDARWWAFYAIGLMAMIAGTPRPAVIRALVWGLTLYAIVLLIGLLMPAFHGGLKAYAYAYDPRMRLHYGQAIFLLPVVAWAISRSVARPGLAKYALIALLSAAVSVTLTRTLLVSVLGIAAITAIWTVMASESGSRARRPSLAARLTRLALPSILAVGVGIVGGFGAYSAGVQIWVPAGGGALGLPGALPSEERPVLPTLNRVFEENESTGVGAQAGGRLASYGIAFVDTAQSPVIGHGMGQLAHVPWAWGGFRTHTAGTQPGVDNAYLTVGLKAGAIGIAAFAAMMLWPLRLVAGRANRRLRHWFVPAWLGIGALTLLQSFAVSGYAPFALSLLLVLPALTGRRAIAAARGAD